MFCVSFAVCTVLVGICPLFAVFCLTFGVLAVRLRLVDTDYRSWKHPSVIAMPDSRLPSWMRVSWENSTCLLVRFRKNKGLCLNCGAYGLRDRPCEGCEHPDTEKPKSTGSSKRKRKCSVPQSVAAAETNLVTSQAICNNLHRPKQRFQSEICLAV